NERTECAVHTGHGLPKRTAEPAAVECCSNRLRLETRHSNSLRRPGRLELEVHEKLSVHLRVRGPKTPGDFLGTTVLERIHVAPDSGIDLQRLIINKTELYLRAGANGTDSKLERLKSVSGCQACVI